MKVPFEARFQVWLAIESGSEDAGLFDTGGAEQLASLAIALSEC
jgi:hypothetical protein